MSILLVRHGETEGNRKRAFQQPETPLSERGVAQARQLGERLAGMGVGAIIASDYARPRKR
jgi:broad specificity phosphatase PhoE